MSDCDDVRSTDGSDSEGSLREWIARSDEEEDHSGDGLSSDDDEVTTLVNEFPFEKSLLEENTTDGPRRSRRNKRTPNRYVDNNYAQIMLADVSDFEEEEEDDDDDDDSYSYKSSDEDDDEPPAKKIKTMEDNGVKCVTVLLDQ